MPFSQCKTETYTRDYSKFNEIALRDEIKRIDWREILSHCYNCDDLFKLFTPLFQILLIKYISLRKLTRKQFKQKRKPWITSTTSGIKTAVRQKNKLFKNFTRTRSYEVLIKLKLYRNKLNHLIKISKRNYYNNYFTNNKKNSKKTWQGIKQIITTKTKRVQPPPKITADGIEITDITKIANELNVFFF